MACTNAAERCGTVFQEDSAEWKPRFTRDSIRFGSTDFAREDSPNFFFLTTSTCFGRWQDLRHLLGEMLTKLGVCGCAFFFFAHGIDESVKASQVSATEEKCKKKMTTKGASDERAKSEAGSQRQDQSSSTKHGRGLQSVWVRRQPLEQPSENERLGYACLLCSHPPTLHLRDVDLYAASKRRREPLPKLPSYP